jgi:hypothetical protein
MPLSGLITRYFSVCLNICNTYLSLRTRWVCPFGNTLSQSLFTTHISILTILHTCIIQSNNILLRYRGTRYRSWLRHYATSRTVAGSNP